jgi:hypothetical protein
MQIGRNCKRPRRSRMCLAAKGYSPPRRRTDYSGAPVSAGLEGTMPNWLIGAIIGFVIAFALFYFKPWG